MISFHLEQSMTLPISHFQWHNVIKPETEATLTMTAQGLNVAFKVKEENPLVTVHEQIESMPKVCNDSTIELFLSFPDEKMESGFTPFIEKSFYTNIEINSAGICQAKFGHSRKNRTPYSMADVASLQIKSVKFADGWGINFVVPRELIQKLIGYDGFAVGAQFAFNLYKISETKECEHYGAFNKIDSDTPNFHLPQCFVLARVAD